MRHALVTSILLAATSIAAAVPHLVRQDSLTTIPIIKRSSQTMVNVDGSVNFGAVNSHVSAIEAKIHRGLESFEKNTGMAHPSAVKNAERRRGVGQTLGTDGHDWYGVVLVGTPQWGFNVAFDTGSSDFFLSVANCDGCATGENLTPWDPTALSTAQDTGRQFVLYGSDVAPAIVSGEQYTDIVTLGGFSATGQTICTVTGYFGPSSPRFSMDGLMGMGFPAISDVGSVPVFNTLVAEGQVGDPVFSFKLKPSGGQLYIGGANPVLYIGDFAYAPVITQGFWQVNMDNIQVNGQIALQNVDCIIDTGATFIIGPPSDVAAFYGALNATSVPSSVPSYSDGYYAFPCSSFPTISLTFGGTSFDIPSSLLNLGTMLPGSDLCVSSILGQDTGTTFWSIGGTFLQSVYTSFDVGNARVGFAQLAY